MLRYLNKFRCDILGPFGEENSKRLGVKNKFKAVAPSVEVFTYFDNFWLFALHWAAMAYTT